MDGARWYTIRVRGRVPDDWSDRLGGLRIDEVAEEAGEAVTSLMGEVTDRAALAGILTTLYSLHLTVLSMESGGIRAAPSGDEMGGW